MKITHLNIAFAATVLLSSCTTVVEPDPAPITTTQATTTTTATDPYTGTSTYKKTTTTAY